MLFTSPNPTKLQMRKNIPKPQTNKSLAKGNDGPTSKLTVTDLYVNPKPGCSKDPDNVLLITHNDASKDVEVPRKQFGKPKMVELPTKKSGRPTKKPGRPRKCPVQLEGNKPTKKRGRPRKKLGGPTKVPAEASKEVGRPENVIQRRKSLRSSDITERTPDHNISLPKSSEATPSRCRYKLRNSFFPDVDMASRNMGQHNPVDKDPLDQLREQKPLRTYQNTRRLKTLNDPPMRILEFQDCRNKENIIKWLEDSQNLFDRFTQTQADVVGSNLQDDFINDDNVLVFEMPSASQVGPKVVPKPLAAVKVGKRNRSRSISKFRARSLNVHIKKNNQGSSSKRHSLAGDTPSMEDYHIEEVVSCKEFPVCQENDVKALLHLMDDDCLDSLENETLPHENNGRDTHNVTGWTRIEDIKKSIKKKQPKQLKIIVNKSNVAAKRTALGRCISVENNVLETFFEKNMKTAMKETKESGSKEERKVEVQKNALIQRVIDSWHGLKENLEVIAKNGNNKETENNFELQRVFIEMGEFMKKLRNDTFVNAMVQTSSPELASCFTQTAIISQTNSEVQTDVDSITLQDCQDLNSVDAETQTGLKPEREILLANAQAQTDPHCISQNSVYIQTKSQTIVQSSAQVQTDSDEVVQCSGKNETDNLRIAQNIVQARRVSQACPQIVPQTSSVQDHCKTSATPNNVPQSNASRQSIFFNTIPRDQPAVQVPCEGLSQGFDVFIFETEDFLKAHEASRSQNSKVAVQQVSQVVMESQEEVASNNESNLMASGPTNELKRDNSGLKRPLPPQPVVGASNKRPCHRFLRDNLSVSIISETDSSPIVVPPIDTGFQMSSDDSNEYDIRLNELMMKYDNTVENEATEPVVKLPESSRTHKLINEYDTKIHNMTKCKPTIEKSTHEDCASNVFQICKPSTSHQQSNVEKEQHIINSSKVNFPEDRALHEECLGIKTCSTISDIVPDSESPGVVPRRSLFNTKPKTVVGNKAKIPNCDITIITKDDHEDEDLWQSVQRLSYEKDEADITLTESNIDTILGEINGQGSGQASLPCQQAMVEQTTSDGPPTPKRIKIVQDIIIAPSRSKRSSSVCLVDDSDDSLTDCDVVETTPQKKKPNALPDLASSRENYNSMLDVTLPPPLEFQDFEDTTMVCEQAPFEGFMDVSKSQKVSSQLENDFKDLTAACMDVENTSSTSRPKSKITSTPLTQRGCSERYPTLSPIPRKASSLELARQSKLTTLAFVPEPRVQTKYANLNITKQKRILQSVTRSHGSKSSPITFQSSEQKRRVSKKPYSQLRSPSLGELCSKPCVACSRLSREQNVAISSLTDRKLATYSPSFTSKVTHLVVSVNENQQLKDHTAKYVMAVAHGIWVLSFQWVQKCLEANRIVSEEPYEVLDLSGLPGPKTSRLTRAVNPLLKRYKIHLMGTFLSASKEDLRSIVVNLGGEIVEFASELQQLRKQFICVIIAETKSTDDFDLYEDLLEKYGVLSVDIEWLTRSVSKYQVVSFRPYTLCGDEFTGDLGYPPELTEEITLTSTQNM